MNNIVNTIFIYCFGFFLVFRPDIGIGIIFIHIIFIFTCFCLLVEGKVKFIKNKYINMYFFITFFLFIYSLIFSILKTADYSRPYLIFIVLVEVYVCAAYLSKKLVTKNESYLDIYMFLLKVGGIQMIFVFLTIFIPELRDLILSLSRNENLAEISNWGDTPIRSFGFATSYTSTMPSFLAICMAIAVLFFLLNRGAVFLFLIPIFLIGIILNARTPIIVFTIIVSFLLMLSLRYKKISLFFASTLMSIIVLVFILGAFLEVDNSSVARFFDAITEIEELFSGNVTGTFSALSEMFKIPNNPADLIFGMGIDVFTTNELHYHSDSGYIIDLYIYGMLGLLLQLVAILLLYLHGIISYKSIADGRTRIILQFFWSGIFVAYLILHVKGSVFYINEITISIILISFYNYFLSNRISEG